MGKNHIWLETEIPDFLSSARDFEHIPVLSDTPRSPQSAVGPLVCNLVVAVLVVAYIYIVKKIADIELLCSQGGL